jgi:hypothetical protein
MISREDNAMGPAKPNSSGYGRYTSYMEKIGLRESASCICGAFVNLEKMFFSNLLTVLHREVVLEVSGPTLRFSM